jgi:membrane protein YdbS with pleckstrin-like domain
MRALRKLILGETWVLPLGVALTLAAGLVLDAVAGDDAWWHRGGGFVLLVLVVLALWSALPRRRR